MKHRSQPYYASIKMYDSHSEKCGPEKFYDSVYSIETEHIQVFYVLTGPHATTKAFADSTAQSMEDAWNFYVNKIKMRPPKGPSVSHHFQKKVNEGLYPIEIVDINQVRDPLTIIGESNPCGDNFAITHSFNIYGKNTYGTSQIFMENDFYSKCASNNKDTIFIDGDTCTYSKAPFPLYNKTHNYYYTDEWAKAIRLTSFHEFYHAVQLRYLNMYDNQTFWFEASAAGFEEITNPDIDDHFSYLPGFFDRIGQPLSDSFRNYGASTLLIYLYHNISKNIDKSIWENFSKEPNKPFESQLESSLKPLKLDADSIFHDYSVRLSFSGDRSSAINKKDWIYEDQPKWPTPFFLISDSIKPKVESLAFNFYRNSNSNAQPDFTDFIGKASVISFNNGKATIYKIQSNKTLDSLAPTLSSSDSLFWIFSRIGESESIPIVNNTANPHAYPVPWKNGPLCFAPLPKEKNFIELRTRRGDLISQEQYEGTSYCLQEDQVKSMMAPGIYRFRVGNKGKTTSFIVVY